MKTKIHSNPILKKLGKVEETAEEGKGASYKGVAIKTIFLLLFTVVGFGAFYFLHDVFNGQPLAVEQYNIYMKEAEILIGCLILVVLTPILSWLIKPLSALFGILYSLVQGYTLGVLANISPDYSPFIVIALILTLALVLVLLFLYAKRIVKVTEKFKSVMLAVFGASILISIGIGILSVAMPENPITAFIMSDNGVIGIIGSVLGLIIASMFMLSDFNRVETMVESKLPKKYEWQAAFGLNFTIIWIYMKIFTLLMQAEEHR